MRAVSRPGQDSTRTICGGLRTVDAGRLRRAARALERPLRRPLARESYFDGVEHPLRRSKRGQSRERVLDLAAARGPGVGRVESAARRARTVAGRDRAAHRPRTRPARRPRRDAPPRARLRRRPARPGRWRQHRTCRGLARVALATLDAPDPLDETRGRRVKGHRAGSRPLANGLGFDGFRECEGLRPRRAAPPARREHARTQKVARQGSRRPRRRPAKLAPGPRTRPVAIAKTRAPGSARDVRVNSFTCPSPR